MHDIYREIQNRAGPYVACMRYNDLGIRGALSDISALSYLSAITVESVAGQKVFHCRCRRKRGDIGRSLASSH